MKSHCLVRFLALWLITITSGTHLHADTAASPGAIVRANTTNVSKIKGMHCDACAKGIRAELKLLPGIASAEVDFAKQSAEVTYDTNRIDQARLLKTTRVVFRLAPFGGTLLCTRA